MKNKLKIEVTNDKGQSAAPVFSDALVIVKIDIGDFTVDRSRLTLDGVVIGSEKFADLNIKDIEMNSILVCSFLKSYLNTNMTSSLRKEAEFLITPLIEFFKKNSNSTAPEELLRSKEKIH